METIQDGRQTVIKKKLELNTPHSGTGNGTTHAISGSGMRSYFFALAAQYPSFRKRK